MQIYSLSFIFMFLPVSIVLYYLLPAKYRYDALGILSILFYYLCEPRYFHIFLITLLSEYAISEMLSIKTKVHKNAKPLFIFAVVLNVLMMVILSVRSQLQGEDIPLGTMVITFTSIGYFVDTFKDKEEYIHSFTEFTVFTAFFGKIYRGPLVRVFDFREKMVPGKFPVERVGDGLYHFIRGVGKFVIIAIPLENMYSNICSACEKEMTVIGAWLSIIVWGMMIFYDLSGFCDMARGTGMCFGLALPKNFDFPFLSASVTEFIDKFNITVTGFFRHYVYDNLRTKRSSVVQYVVDTFLIGMLCGLWFGIRIGYVLWGIYIALFIILENTVFKNVLKKIPRFFRVIGTFCITMFSMTFFSKIGIGAIPLLNGMIGRNGISIISNEISYIIGENVLLILAGALFLTKFLSLIFKFFKKYHRSLYGASAVLESCIILVLIVSELS